MQEELYLLPYNFLEEKVIRVGEKNLKAGQIRRNAEQHECISADLYCFTIERVQWAPMSCVELVGLFF